jgi:soluble lytic murein transglycosylase-like protein
MRGQILESKILLEFLLMVGILILLTALISGILYAEPRDPDDPGPPGPTTEYDEFIRAASANYGVQICMIKAVIQQESKFDPKAENGDSKGLMQLNSITLRDLESEASSNHCDHMKVDPWDPEQNINGGTCYLSYLLKKYQYNKELALAAYNWGPTNMDGMIKEHGDDWNRIEPHTPPETQDHVPIVLGHYDRCMSGSWSFI